ncbi:dnaJ homolog subfamily B member 3-like isoform X1 [Vigna unguiculata]|uniref:dnaJ homolog subfamily B member 3-like isoform X1 n=1 Tax=Vigna unguiculata TaxID=3917 RepID=UPI001016EC11|nr:dnaJ homolog subfamily B member 3-like isoform X1 [Vigna unguiculata]XP_027902586.1 dnaJ homolog subfamily B member 3-like isoform X1 [Vigna unguiculata]XP_027902588.1 dnaJ homolog subfamily B member 3-like isoform X1 [Vigna unguiculata]
MAKGGEKCNEELYEVLGIEKECTPSELKNAYKKLALKWHPDRCSGSHEEEGKKKFQAIQHAYSVLSDANTRLLYDVGVYDSDDDQTGMGDFLNEMATMMSQSKPIDNGEESFEEFQQLFGEMFQATAPASPTYIMTNGEGSRSNRRNSTEINFGKTENTSELNPSDQNFCLGALVVKILNFLAVQLHLNCCPCHGCDVIFY